MTAKFTTDRAVKTALRADTLHYRQGSKVSALTNGHWVIFRPTDEYPAELRLGGTGSYGGKTLAKIEKRGDTFPQLGKILKPFARPAGDDGPGGIPIKWARLDGEQSSRLLFEHSGFDAPAHLFTVRNGLRTRAAVRGEYVRMLEDLYPAAVWYADGKANSTLALRQYGKIVAAVMPLRVD